MIKITVPADDAAKLSGSLSDFQLCDPSGKVLATVRRELTPEFIAELKRRASAPGPRFSTAEIQEMLTTLQDAWDREGPFGVERKDQILSDLHTKWVK